jgi:hypothetical protein
MRCRWEGRTIKYHRAEIREWLGFREATREDVATLEAWLIDEILDREHRMDRLKDATLGRCRKLLIEPPAAEQIRRLVGSAVQRHETRFCEAISRKLDSAKMARLDTLLQIDPSEKDKGGWTLWQTLKGEPGKAGLASVKDVTSRLPLLRKVGLPADLFKGVPPKLIERYAKRAAVEEPFELRRHAGPLKVTLMVAFLHHGCLTHEVRCAPLPCPHAEGFFSAPRRSPPPPCAARNSSEGLSRCPAPCRTTGPGATPCHP